MQPRSAHWICQSCRRTNALRLPLARRRTYATAATSSTTATPEIYDVVCVGGGPAGLSLLSGLRSSPVTAGLKMALIEGQDLDKGMLRNLSPTTFANRCSSLTPASVENLKDIGAWQHIDHGRVQPYQEMQVWDGVSDARISFDWPSTDTFLTPRRPTDPTTIAYMIENANLTTGLLTRLNNLGGVDTFSPTRVESIDLGPEEPLNSSSPDLRSWPHITLSNGRTLTARLLIGADGANSPVRTFAGITSRGWDYERHGVVATLRLSGDMPQMRTAYQRFLPSGPVAMLPLPGNMATLVWSTHPARAALLRSLAPNDQAALIDAAFRLCVADLDYLHTMTSGQDDEVAWRLQHSTYDQARVPGRVAAVQPNSVAAFPLRMRHADAYSGHRVALVGDAAHTIHPLAGQGLNQGQADAAALVRTISHAVAAGDDIGSTIALESYDAARWQANNALLGACDKLHKLYSVGWGPIVGLRSLGLKAADSVGAAKGLFMGIAASNGR
ncbi:ubiquinone biosynthesis monooxygenase COQ6 [Phyllosticta citribraziliensis]|uniref:Ubiquinone biosynthesis monooxygenase COQ6, mitochondrial n=1 Tax=Phyllosticta citribraziliensis TaxID=989973 RepID=A0ABR1LZK1_9PEZI